MWKKLIVNECDKRKFESYLINYGAETIINDFKWPFIYDTKQDLFLNDINCLWIIELFNFDRQSSSYVLKNILNIERRLANAVSIMIEDSIIKLKNIDKYDGFILKENKKVINFIFSDFREIDKKRIIKFLRYVNENQNNKDKTIIDLFNIFKRIYFKKLDDKNNWFKLFKEIFKIKSIDKTFDEIGMRNIFDADWQEIVEEKISLFSSKQMKELISKNFKNNNELGNYDIKNKTLTTLSKKWTLGNLIKIYESLNYDIKKRIIEYMFSSNNFYSGDNFVYEFIQIMKSFKMVRNRICHNEPIYNFETTFSHIYEFLNKNNIYSEVKYGRVKVNICIVIECLIIFNQFDNSRNKYDLKYWIL
ncbi:MAG: Abi family protein, partial [Ureaplasma sp.]|nr:Abi family protein [Ureaplasma sp.]